MAIRIALSITCCFLLQGTLFAQFGKNAPNKGDGKSDVATTEFSALEKEADAATAQKRGQLSEKAADIKTDNPVTEDKTSPVPRRKVAEWNKLVSAALRREAVAKEDTERIKAILALVTLYNEGAQARYLPEIVRKDIRHKMRARLIRIQKELKRKYCSNDDGKKLVKTTGATAENDPESAAYQGGGNKAPGPARGGGAKLDDYADELIEIIQATISPDTWDVNGGNGAIYYYRIGKALVVRAPQQAHDNVGELLEGLRRAGQ